MRFIESILYKDGKYHHLTLHEKRFFHAIQRFMPNVQSHPDLRQLLPPINLEGIYKVRVVYHADTDDLNFDVEYTEYVSRKIESLEVVESEVFDYSFKYEDRTAINSLVRKSKADDIIISMDGKITDGSYFNLAFWDGSAWHTPDTPLLNGVRRQLLLSEKKIKEAPITIQDLGAFEKVSLINAMLDLGEVQVTMSNVLK